MRTYLSPAMALVTPEKLDKHMTAFCAMNERDALVKMKLQQEKLSAYVPMIIQHSEGDMKMVSSAVAILAAVFEVLDQELSQRGRN